MDDFARFARSGRTRRAGGLAEVTVIKVCSTSTLSSRACCCLYKGFGGLPGSRQVSTRPGVCALPAFGIPAVRGYPFSSSRVFERRPLDRALALAIGEGGAQCPLSVQMARGGEAAGAKSCPQSVDQLTYPGRADSVAGRRLFRGRHGGLMGVAPQASSFARVLRARCNRYAAVPWSRSDGEPKDRLPRKSSVRWGAENRLERAVRRPRSDRIGLAVIRTPVRSRRLGGGGLQPCLRRWRTRSGWN